MHGTLRSRIDEHRKIERQICQGTDKIVARNFGRVAKLLWPVKTAAHIATVAKTSERTAERWLSGEFDPPYCIIEATMRAIFGRD